MRQLTSIRATIAPGFWALVLVFSAACGASIDANHAIVDQGGRLYTANCASCHGASGEGQPDWKALGPDGRYPAPPHDTSGHTWHHGDGLLFQIVKDGGASLNVPGFVSGMPAFGDQLSDDEVRSVLSYLKTFWGPRERAFQAQVTAQERR